MERLADILGITIPIIPGVMPIQNYSSFRRLVNLTQCPVPDEIWNDLEPIKSDDAAVKQYGARLATKMVERLLSQRLVQGVHFCTLNLEKSVRTIMENLGWSGAVSSVHSSPRARLNQLIADDDTSSVMSIRASDANELAQWGLTRTRSKQSTQTQKINGAVAVAGEDSWDEFPNGRFTDVRSPAYGEIDGWGSGLKTTPAQALREWGAPATSADLATLFQGYLRGEKPTTPFCDLPLSPESNLILPHLLALNSAEKQHWTVGSQPAVDAAPSADPMHGWGPPGGYVFQKAFVEFFVPLSVVEELEDKIAQLDPSRNLITMYASNRTGEYRTNSLKDDVNSVTWAVFPGQEIVTSTIIEEISFIAWKEEAFDIWAEWAVLYPRGSPARKVIENITNDWWLVSLIHHDYKDKDGLWKFLLD